MSDAPGSFSVGLKSRFLPEDRRLGESHDLAEAPRIGCVERPVLPLELPGLLGGVLRQCPLGLLRGWLNRLNRLRRLRRPPPGFAADDKATSF